VRDARPTRLKKKKGTGYFCDSAEKVFFRKSEKNISHTDAV
jgi:hypothetical protein